VVKEINDSKSIALKLDVSKEEEIKDALKKIGKIDILVNNAGVFLQEELDKMDTSKIEKMLDVNLKGLILLTKNVLPGMKKRKYGKIVNIASIAGFVGFDSASIYCATKGGIVNLTRELASEVGKYGINVNAVAPGLIKTDMTKDFFSDKKTKEALLSKIPYGRAGRPEDIASAVSFLVKDESEYITGHTLVVEGGWLTL
jgi:NAD(P)-dependent dehydrogenase (short-subunit alcohol dehydrogenase family)